MVSKIMRKFSDELSQPDEGETVSMDVVKATLIGTLLDREGERRNVFKRTLESVPEIDSQCFIMADDVLTAFMGVISGADSAGQNSQSVKSMTKNFGQRFKKSVRQTPSNRSRTHSAATNGTGLYCLQKEGAKAAS